MILTGWLQFLKDVSLCYHFMYKLFASTFLSHCCSRTSLLHASYGEQLDLVACCRTPPSVTWIVNQTKESWVHSFLNNGKVLVGAGAARLIQLPVKQSSIKKKRCKRPQEKKDKLWETKCRSQCIISIHCLLPTMKIFLDSFFVAYQTNTFLMNIPTEVNQNLFNFVIKLLIYQ